MYTIHFLIANHPDCNPIIPSTLTMTPCPPQHRTTICNICKNVIQNDSWQFLRKRICKIYKKKLTHKNNLPSKAPQFVESFHHRWHNMEHDWRTWRTRKTWKNGNNHPDDYKYFICHSTLSMTQNTLLTHKTSSDMRRPVARTTKLPETTVKKFAWNYIFKKIAQKDNLQIF